MAASPTVNESSALAEAAPTRATATAAASARTCFMAFPPWSIAAPECSARSVGFRGAALGPLSRPGSPARPRSARRREGRDLPPAGRPAAASQPAQRALEGEAGGGVAPVVVAGAQLVGIAAQVVELLIARRVLHVQVAGRPDRPVGRDAAAAGAPAGAAVLV